MMKKNEHPRPLSWSFFAGNDTDQTRQEKFFERMGNADALCRGQSFPCGIFGEDGMDFTFCDLVNEV